MAAKSLTVLPVLRSTASTGLTVSNTSGQFIVETSRMLVMTLRTVTSVALCQ